MKRNEKFREIIDDIEIPQELMPENIALMLKNSQKDKVHIHKTQSSQSKKSITVPIENKHTTVAKETLVKPITVSSNKNKSKKMYMRAIATAAACFLIIAGLTVFMKNGSSGTKIPVQSSDGNGSAVTSTTRSYEDVYNTLKKVYVTETTQSELESIIKQADNDTDEESIYALSKSYNAASVLNIDDMSSIIAQKQQYIAPQKLLNEGNNIYCIANNSIYFIDSNDGNLKLLKQIGRENVTPVGMFIKDSNLVVLSEITTTEKKPTINEPQETTDDTNYSQTIFSSDVTNSSTEISQTQTSEVTTSKTETETKETEPDFGQSIEGFTTKLQETTIGKQTSTAETTKGTTSVVDNSSCEKIIIKTLLAEVYDITDPENPALLNEIRQDGRYICATMNANNVYIASGYDDNKNNIIKGQEDIDKYVPTYTVNGNKNYIPAENIIASENVTNTNYIVVTGVDITSVNPVKTATAMLGFADNIYFSNGNVYAYLNEYNQESQNAVITKLKTNEGTLSEPQSIKVDGVIKDISYINENDGYLRVVASVYDSQNTTFSNRIYIFSQDLQKVGSLSGFGGKTIIKNVRFEGTTAYCQATDEEKTVTAIDCSDPSTPLVFNDSNIKGSVPMVYNLGNDNYVAVGISTDEKQVTNGIEISVYQNTAGSKEYVQATSLQLPETFIDSELNLKINAKVIFVDKEKSQIGISVNYNDGIDICNKFYMVKYSDEKLELVGEPKEYHDVSNIYQFKSSFAVGDNLYIVSTGRIICVDINTNSQLGNILLVEPYNK